MRNRVRENWPLIVLVSVVFAILAFLAIATSPGGSPGQMTGQGPSGTPVVGQAPVVVVQPQQDHFWSNWMLYNALSGNNQRVEEHHYYHPVPVPVATPRPATGSNWWKTSPPSYTGPSRGWTPSRPSYSAPKPATPSFNRPSTSRSFGRRK